MVFNENCMLCFDSGAPLADKYKLEMLNICDQATAALALASKRIIVADISVHFPPTLWVKRLIKHLLPEARQNFVSAESSEGTTLTSH